MPREFRTVGVVGLGTMGAGIAEVLARAGLSVVGVEPTSGGLERAPKPHGSGEPRRREVAGELERAR